jgi:pre-rRNA-processing protein TSR1
MIKAVILQTKWWRAFSATPSQQWSLQSQVVPDPMAGEQTWPTPDELADAERAAKMRENDKKQTRLVPRGTSEYQAAWIVDEDDGGSVRESGEEDADEEEMDAQSAEDEDDGADAEFMKPLQVAGGSVAGDRKSVRFDDSVCSLLMC